MAAYMESDGRRDTQIMSWGANSYGQLAAGSTEDKLQPEKSAPSVRGSVRGISGGGGHTALITYAGECFLCGNNNKGQLGMTSGCNSLTLWKLPLPYIISKVSCGWEHTLALTDSGAVLAWGSNSHGQAGMAVDTPTPTKLEGFSGQRVTDIAAGLRHSLALTADGSVWSWGCGRRGQLGQPEELKRGLSRTHQPSRVPDISKGNSLAAGSHHSIVITSDSQLFCWGDNKRGQLGLEPNDRDVGTLVIPEPREVDLEGLRIAQVASGWTHVLILSDGGDVYSWGRNNFGQLGRPPGCCRDDNIRKICWKPARIAGIQSVKQISCGSEHNIVLTKNGEVFCWGWNEHGMCGDGTETDVLEPKRVEGLEKLNVYTIGSGAGHCMVASR